MLSPDQKTFFETFGFLVLQEVLTDSEMNGIDQDFEEVLEETPVPESADVFDSTQDGQTIFKVGTQWFLSRREDELHKRSTFRSVLKSERIRSVIKGLLGPGSYLTGNVAKRFASGTDWHCDLGWDPNLPLGKLDPLWPQGSPASYYYGLKAAIYLEPLRKKQGP